MYLFHRRKHFRPAGTLWTANGDVLDPLNGNLVACWHLEEASGNRIDQIGSYAAVPSSDQGNAAGKYGNGVNIASAATLTIATATLDIANLVTQSFTFLGWFKTNDTYQRAIFMCAGAAWGGTGNGGFALWRRNDSGNVINARLYSAAGASVANVVSLAAYNDNQFHHVAVVYNTVGPVLSLYTDNVKATTVPSAAVGDNGNDACIGNSHGDGAAWDSVLDEFHFYNIPFSDDQVSAHYNSGVGAFYLG